MNAKIRNGKIVLTDATVRETTEILSTGYQINSHRDNTTILERRA